MSPAELAATWRQEAEVLRRRGASTQADLLDSCAEDLLRWARERELEALTLEQAAAESGYSRRGLERAVEEGRLSNVGQPGHPRIARGELGRKHRRLGPELHEGGGVADRMLRARGRAQHAKA